MEHEQQHSTGPTFDTLKTAQALEKAGFTGVQAKAVTHAIVEAQDNLASKADLRDLRAATKADLKEHRAEIMGEFKAQRAENKRMEETLRADNKRMEETLRAEIQSLKDGIATLQKLFFLVTVPLAVGVAGTLLGVVIDMFFLNG